MQVTVEYIRRMRQTLLDFHQQAGVFIQSNGSVPATGSQALAEQASASRAVSILTAYSLGSQLIEFGGEHLTAFVKTVTEPVELIACWTCVRSMLESCALAAWLLDPDIDAHNRIGRTFALRYEGMEQQLKFGRAIGLPETEISKLQTRINEVEQNAIDVGFARVLCKKGARMGERIGIAQVMPGATDMIKLMLNEEIMYRMLSGVAHGHHWAINQLCYMPAETCDMDVGGIAAVSFDKTTDLRGIALLGVTTFKSLARPLWNQCRYFGWEALRIEELLENAADGLDMVTDTRFWRS